MDTWTLGNMDIKKGNMDINKGNMDIKKGNMDINKGNMNIKKGNMDSIEPKGKWNLWKHGLDGTQ